MIYTIKLSLHNVFVRFDSVVDSQNCWNSNGNELCSPRFFYLFLYRYASHRMAKLLKDPLKHTLIILLINHYRYLDNI